VSDVRAPSQIAAGQRGLVTHAQLLAAGIGARTIKSWASNGRLHRVYRGVYLVGHSVMPPLGHEMAAVLATNGVLSHGSAAALWQLTGPSPPIHVTTPHRHCRSRDGFVAHRARYLDPRDLTTRHDIPVTKPARTLLDLAETATLRETERAYDEALTRRLITPHAIRQLIERAEGRQGIAVLAALLDRDGGPTLTRSEAEELMLALVRAADLPHPEVNQRVEGREVDFLWRLARLVVEVDGFAWHGRTSAAYHRDHAKVAHLEARGWTVKRVTYRQLERDRLATAARLARWLAEGTRAHA